MTAKDPQERSAIARHARLVGLSRLDADGLRQTTQAAREARQKNLEDQVDPNRELSAEEREDLIRELRRAQMAKLTAKSIQVRRERAAERAAQRQRQLIEAAEAAKVDMKSIQDLRKRAVGGDQA